ncbi:MAG TPA: hypothetical protein ENK93_01440 [Campylobacteraceae bacterium]|jgi:oxaloacetate decarboxylase gamma subunit|nr:hypothetical protein [Campylobacteraceae bacterium]
MEVNMTMEGLKFMVLGMTTVFLFLLLMIAVLKLQKKLLDKYFPPKPVSVTPVRSTVQTAASATEEEEETIAAITAAITEFKKG